jgi:hypothetical protein
VCQENAPSSGCSVSAGGPAREGEVASIGVGWGLFRARKRRRVRSRRLATAPVRGEASRW